LRRMRLLFGSWCQLIAISFLLVTNPYCHRAKRIASDFIACAQIILRLGKGHGHSNTTQKRD
jgi:hypothetical protein